MGTNEALKQKLYYNQYLKDLSRSMVELEVTNQHGQLVSQEEALLSCCGICKKIKLSHNTMYFIGNGASACMASHMAADFNKTCGCRATSFNDIALMTAVSNDVSYEECFSIPLSRFAVKKDALITISSSGNSPNIINAIHRAKDIGLSIITFSGMNPNNQSRKLGHFNFWLPANTYGLVEAGHQILLHCWLDTYLEINM
jgi:D-sedoheptulose 7-phosphate isomerase